MGGRGVGAPVAHCEPVCKHDGGEIDRREFVGGSAGGEKVSGVRACIRARARASVSGNVRYACMRRNV